MDQRRRGFARLPSAVAFWVALSLGAAAQAGTPTMYLGSVRIWGGGSVNGTPAGQDATWSGVASLTGASPAAIQLQSNEINWFTSVVNPNPPTQAGVLASTQVITVSGPPTPGSLMAGGGPGNFLFNPPTGIGPRTGTAQVTAGPNQFGGSVKVLFNFRSKLAFASPGGGAIAGTFPILPVMGTSGTQTFNASFVATQPPAFTTPITVQWNNWKWTTGVAFAMDTAGQASTTTTWSGYDNRTPNGLGTIQLVSPALYSSFGFFNNTGSLANVMKLQFLPEPTGTLMLVLGGGALASLALIRRRAS